MVADFLTKAVGAEKNGMCNINNEYNTLYIESNEYLNQGSVVSYGITYSYKSSLYFCITKL